MNRLASVVPPPSKYLPPTLAPTPVQFAPDPASTLLQNLPAPKPSVAVKKPVQKPAWQGVRQWLGRPGLRSVLLGGLQRSGFRTSVGLGLLSCLLQAGAALGAERLTVSYGVLERSLSIASLTQYVVEGTVSQDLKSYIGLLNEAQREQLRKALQAQVHLDVVAVAQFLYTEQGESLLRQLGEVVRTDSNLSGFFALRSAMILAADDPAGLTVLNVLQQFPLDNIRLDLGRTLEILGELQTLIQDTQDAILLVDQQSAQEAEAENSTPLPDLRQPGHFLWQVQSSIQIDAPHRPKELNRFPIDLYLPETEDGNPLMAAPIVVISHGLGSDRDTYAYLARQLASYGFVVAVPEHPGSNADQLQALISGRASEVTAATEFIDRPRDITQVLNTLATLHQQQPNLMGRFNLDQVGVIGQSFGGYTALALAGAQINFPQLTQDCSQGNPYNLSLLLQCRALELSQPLPSLQDPRVKSVIAINPIGSSLLGATDYAKVQIPVMLISSSSDTIAPALPEQLHPFTWLEATEKYLVLLKGGTHFSTIDVPETAQGETFQLPPEIVGPDPELAHGYIKMLGVAFFQTYLTPNPSYQPYLTATYVQSVSQPLLPITLIRSLSAFDSPEYSQNPR